MKNSLYTQVIGTIALIISLVACTTKPGGETKPNIIYIMLDEMGYFEPSYMGNEMLETPNIDKMATEGVFFTNAYAGASLCAPTRVSLMTGRHMGHASMRSNSGGMPIRADEKTVASILKEAGYATGGFGKWGCGNRGTSGVPEKHGFDIFYGYYDQVHAHTFYPKYLIKNSEEVLLEGNDGYHYKGGTHAQNSIFEEAVKFIKTNADKPFFCYLPWTPPHGLWGIDEDDPSYLHFKDKAWKVEKSWREDDGIRYAALLHKVDTQIGEIFQLLKELELDENTIVFVCGDNGGQAYFRSEENPNGLFGPNVNPTTGEVFKGSKGNIYEGGLKIPMVVRWPGKIAPDTKNEFVWYFPDFMATVADIVNVEKPTECDGLSILPTLFGKGLQKEHEYMFWTGGGRWAVRSGDWKAVSAQFKGKSPVDWELYKLTEDKGEITNVAEAHPEQLKKLIDYAFEAFEEPVKGEIYDQELYAKDHKTNLPKPPKNKSPK
ncbi:MAG: arylsulfatase [Bacteroidetes bacterium]|jgi:arylsulfatase A|nr:arylsulfatase [Bacteroidota bacterium]MBT3749421.1 arylsulfatase [Bacteroidota bacterium]MBT4401863.1 arylsulfatase [Bacteroidota bacterium]MBT4411082.1 arylsulfatase [Bacteroidota bacterium]MBT7094002.1 arylsulfatase [Bacteroidota bacterium]